MTIVNQRQDIRNRIEAGEARHRGREESTMLDRAGETAIEAKDRFAAFAQDHPVTTVVGGLALGVLISGLFPRSPTRRAGAKVAGVAALGAEAALAFLNQAVDAAGHAASDAGRAAGRAGRAGADRLEDWSDTLGDTARKVKRNAACLVEEKSDNARIARRDAGKRLSRLLHRRH